MLYDQKLKHVTDTLLKNQIIKGPLKDWQKFVAQTLSPSRLFIKETQLIFSVWHKIIRLIKALVFLACYKVSQISYVRFSLREPKYILAIFLRSLNKSPAAFSMEKLKWFNKEYLSKKSTQEILDLLLQTDSQFTDSDYSRNVIDLVKDRCSLINDFLLESKYFFTEIQEYDQKAVSKNIKDNSSMIIKSLHTKLETAEALSPEEITIAIEEVMVEFEVGFGKVGLPFRIALTGSTSSPSIDQTASLLGKSIVQSRLLKFIEEFSP